MVFGWGHDEEYVGVTPGLIPPAGTGQVQRIKGRKEWSGTVAVQFQPPAGVSPSLAGTVVDGSVDSKDLGAMLIDLSLRGWYKITKDEDRNDWIFELPSTPPPGDRLSAEETRMVQGIFPGGRSQVRLSQVKPRLAEPLRWVRDDLYAEVVRRGWYRRSPAGRGLDALRGRSPRTADGTAVRIQTLGFRKYLATAEASQIKYEEAAGLFSRYLPYAMIFGLADRWAGVIGQVFRAAQLEGINIAALDMATNPFMWFLADDMLDLGASAVMGLADVLTDGGIFDIGGALGDALGGLGDMLGDIDIGDFFDW